MKHALPVVLPLTMVYHFNTRAYATTCIVIPWWHYMNVYLVTLWRQRNDRFSFLQSDFMKHALPVVLPWTMVYHFNTRAYATACLVTLWRHCKESGLTSVLEENALLNSVVQFHERNATKWVLHRSMLGMKSQFHNVFSNLIFKYGGRGFQPI